MRLKHLPLLGAIAFSVPAFAVTVNMTDFVFPASPAVVVLTGSPAGPSQTVYAGEFLGTYTDSALASAGNGTLRAAATIEASSTSFMAWCIDLQQSFSFGTPYEYSMDPVGAHFSPAGVDALSRLFTAAQGFVVDSATSAAMQAAIWEIEYETGNGGFDLFGGSFMAALQSPTAATTSAFNTVNGYLMTLESYSANYRFEVLGSGENQDFLIAIGPVPEPETWAMLVAGFGALGWAARRKAAREAAKGRATA